jgi:hypothetical protein
MGPRWLLSRRRDRGSAFVTTNPPPPVAAPPVGLRNRVLAAAANAPARPRSDALRVPLFVVGAAIFAGGVGQGVSQGCGGAGRNPWFAFLLPAVCAAILTTAAIVRRRGMFGPPLEQLVLSVIAGPVALVLLAIAANAPSGQIAPSLTPPGTHAGLGLACASSISLMALAPPHDPMQAGWNGASLGAAAGAWVSLACSLTCTSLELPHVLLRHLLWVPALAVVGALAGHFDDRGRFGSRRGP